MTGGSVVTKRRRRLTSGFSLGGEAAETDALLELAFYESSDYRVLESRADRRCFVVGRTGAGKSAALQHLEEAQAGHVIRVSPSSLSLPYITDLQVFRYLDSLDVHLDLLWIALWKHVLLVEIIRHRYKVDSPEAKQNVMTALRERFKRDSSKIAALDYLESFQGRFWCEADIRVREVADSFTKRVEAVANAGADTPFGTFGAKGTAASERTSSSRTEEALRYQRIVNDTQLARLNKMLDIVREDILSKPQDFVYIVIDDLDLNWIDDRLANDLIRCLFQTVFELQRIPNLKVLVALRTNIFDALDFGPRGGQEEKFRALVLPMRWTRSDLVEVLDERVKVAGPNYGLEAGATLSDILPSPNNAMGNPIDYILDRTLMRPRDAIAFANECLGLVGGKSRLSWTDIKAAERSYSTNRLKALKDEWKPTYPGIGQVLEVFRAAPARIDKREFESRLLEVMLLLGRADFEGLRWLTPLAQAVWESGGGETWFAQYQPLTRLLYAIGFVGCATGNTAPTFYADDPLYLDNESQTERTQFFFIHRAYHLALDVRQAGRQG